MEKKREKNHIAILLVLFLGVVLRYWVMSFGYNYDFESYCIVGELAGHLRNVYEQTNRYNYGSVFFCIQGILYRMSFLISTDPLRTYRVLIVSTLTLADIAIAVWIADVKNIKSALIFFLNPVSIIITGYHNQFDNIAVMLALYSLYYYNESEKIELRDWLFVLGISFSLMVKHILFAVPAFILFKRSLTLKKKFLYAFVPPAIFLAGFIPFAIQSREACQGILYNVFLYRSFNNAPLMCYLYKLINFPPDWQIYVFGILMCIMGFAVCRKDFKYCIMTYLISLVAFSSAITNQYLVIPMVALCAFELKVLNYIYMAAVSFFLFLNANGFGQLSFMEKIFSDNIYKLLFFYEVHGYQIAAWILFLSLMLKIAGSMEWIKKQASRGKAI